MKMKSESEVSQSCLTLNNPMDCSLVSIFIMEKMCVCVCVCVRVRVRVRTRARACALSHVQLLVTPWSIAHQVHLSMRFPRQEYWSRLPFPTPGDLPDPGIEPALAGIFFTTAAPGKPQ